MAYRKGSLKREIEKNVEKQIPLFQPPSTWTAPAVNTLPSWADAKRVSIDIETEDEHLRTLGVGVRRGARIVGVSFAIEDGPSTYLPVGHPDGNLPAEHVFHYLRDQSACFEGDVVGANLPYDMDFLWEAGITFPKVKRYLDVQVAEPLIDEMQDSYSLEAIAGRHGLPGKDESLLKEAATAWYVDPKKGLHQLPARFVGPYAIQDVLLPLTILRRQERIIEERNIGGIFDLETRLLPALLAMRRRGVLIDQKRLQYIEDWSLSEQRKAHSIIREMSGVRLAIDEINKAKALEAVLRTIADIKIGVTANGQPNIDTKMLEALKSPLANAIMRAKKMDKLRNTFAASVRRFMCKGRIHATFNQLRAESAGGEEGDDKGVRYGRLSCVNPNLQQQPSKDAEYENKKEKNLLGPDDFHMGKLWRSIYIPEPGQIWAALDYSGQEPRMTVHYAAASGCQGGVEFALAYVENPNLDLHQKMADIAGIKRKAAKTIFLGLAYGMGGAKLCHSLGLPTKWVHSPKFQKMIEIAGPEGQAILDRFNELVPFIKQLTRKCQDRAGERGYITTLLGRQLHFPLKKDFVTKQPTGGYDWLHKALNRLVQGSSADQTKLAVVTAYEEGIPLQLQVHDEIDLSVPDEAYAQHVADIMRNCVKLRVPSKVDVECGASWGDSM